MPSTSTAPYPRLVLRSHLGRSPVHGPAWPASTCATGPGAIRSDGLGAKLTFFQTLVRSGSRNRGRLPLRLPDRLRLPAPHHRGELIPDDVEIQVLVQCRQELIERTFESLAGAPRAMVHFYNSVSELSAAWSLALTRPGMMTLRSSGRAVQEVRGADRAGRIRYEYSPESFTGTEPISRSRSARR